MVIGLDGVEDLDDVRMLKFLEEFDLPPDGLFSLRVFDALFLVDFDGNFLIAGLVESYSNASVGSLTC